MKIAVITPIGHLNGVLDLLHTKGEVVLHETASKEQVRNLLINDNIDTILCNPNQQTYKIDEELLQGTSVKLINTCSTGMNHIDVEYCNDNDIKIFSLTKDYDLISSGEFHDKWFLELKNNDFVDKITGKKVNDETMRLLEIQKDSMVKFLMKIPKLYYTKSHFPLEISQRAFDHLWRICESYEMWCKETKQEKLIVLDILS